VRRGEGLLDVRLDWDSGFGIVDFDTETGGATAGGTTVLEWLGGGEVLRRLRIRRCCSWRVWMSLRRVLTSPRRILTMWTRSGGFGGGLFALEPVDVPNRQPDGGLFIILSSPEVVHGSGEKAELQLRGRFGSCDRARSDDGQLRR